MKTYYKLIFEVPSMFFRMLIAIAVLYILGINAPSFQKINIIAGICSIIWITNIPFWIEHFGLKQEEVKKE